MKRILTLSAVVLALAGGSSLFAQETTPSDTQAQSKASADPPGADKSPSPQEELESKFKAALTKATLRGRWCSIKDGKMSPEKDDKYTILSVAKIGGDVWLINARIQYGERNIVAPIPVRVKWAGDTPVIVVDKVGIPGGSTYSARVLIFEKTYAGTWTGGDHGGLLNGVITNDAE